MNVFFYCYSVTSFVTCHNHVWHLFPEVIANIFQSYVQDCVTSPNLLGSTQEYVTTWHTSHCFPFLWSAWWVRLNKSNRFSHHLLPVTSTHGKARKQPFVLESTNALTEAPATSWNNAMEFSLLLTKYHKMKMSVNVLSCCIALWEWIHCKKKGRLHFSFLPYLPLQIHHPTVHPLLYSFRLETNGTNPQSRMMYILYIRASIGWILLMDASLQIHNKVFQSRNVWIIFW